MTETMLPSQEHGPIRRNSDSGGGDSFRRTAYPIAIIIALAVAVIVATLNARTADDHFGGDYPAFYGAGQIAASGDWGNLYSLDRQIEAQQGLHSSSEGEVARFFAYPPQVAFLYQPFAAFDYYTSYLLHTLLMGVLVWVALLLARPMIPWLRGRIVLGLAMSMVFWPMFRTVTGGSNTALTLVIIVGAWRLVYEDHQLLAGLTLAGLMYKPQFALPMVGLFLMARHWKVVMGAAAGAVVFYLSGVFLLGWNWVIEWVDVAGEFGRIDAVINGHSSVSFIGFAENLFGVGMSVPVALAWLLAAATALFLAWIWYSGSSDDLALHMGLAMPGILLLSLHAMSHDGALIVVTAAVGVMVWPMRAWLPWVGGIWMLGASQAFIKQLGFSPGFLMLLLALLWACLLLAEKRRQVGSVVAEGRRVGQGT